MRKFLTSLNTRRNFLTTAGVLSTGVLVPASVAMAQSAKIRVGLMLPYTGTFAQLGVAITNGFKLAVDERGGKLAEEIYGLRRRWHHR